MRRGCLDPFLARNPWRRSLPGSCGGKRNYSTIFCLVLREGDGVALITGCAHPGIINMVRTVQTRLKLPVRSVVGGTHLKDASDERIERTLTVLREWGVRRMALCHCSGNTVRDRLSADAVTGCSLSTGDFIELQ